MKANTHYTPVEDGFSIRASSELFNRTLYGSHKNDDAAERFCTFAGDAPQFMGATTDWQKNLYSFYAKRGTLTSGLALTPGQRVKFFYSDDMDTSSRWFHNSEDVNTTFRNGWMEYDLTQMSSFFPDVQVHIETYPLLPDDGFLVHYQIKTDQRIVFVAGFGGITDYIGRFDYKDDPIRYFHATDCAENTVEIGDNRACVRHANGTCMRIAASFPSSFGIASAKSLASPYPSTFLTSTPEGADDEVVKISTVIEPGKVLDGYLIVLHNTDETILNQWLARKDPIRFIKQQIYAKHACIDVHTPEMPLDLTIAPTVIALDSSWHKNSFHHGAFAYHAPFLGWRNWYAPTALGWNDRVETTISAHLNQIAKNADGEERIWYDGTTPLVGDWGDWPSPYHRMENSTGFLPHFLGVEHIEYNMQECALDMILYSIEWTGNLAIAQKYFADFSAMLDWEERIFDPDHDGLYQNFLNTWISDGHSYNGAGCAQASAYNYRANLVMAKIAEKLGVSSAVFTKRAEKIKRAVEEKLWLANLGVIAESIDTIGNCLIHPAPELSTAYLAIDCGMVSEFQAYTMLKYTENHIKSIVTTGSEGRLSYSSTWRPKKYSTFGIFPSENAHLALAYFQLGLKEMGKKIVDGLVDCYFTGKNPGMAAHVQSALGTADLADLDFTDVSSTYLRLMIEGLFGIRFHLLDEYVMIAPGFPDDWDSASLTLKDISLHYHKRGTQLVYDISCDKPCKKRFRIPLTKSCVDAVLLDGEPVSYHVKPAPNNSFLMVETDKIGRFQLRVMLGNGTVPHLCYSQTVLASNEMIVKLCDGELAEFFAPSDSLEEISVIGNTLYAKAKHVPGNHTLFIRAKAGEYDAWLAADYEILEKESPIKPLLEKPFRPVDISAFFNCNMTEVHTKKYLSPRPSGYSIGSLPNGRYGWDWNHRGHNKVLIDDQALREANGMVSTPSGIPFLTPAKGENLACVSLWDNFPTELTIPLSGTAEEIALLFVATTNAMQTQVENVRITVSYNDGTETSIKLIYPINIDDWLTPALQTQNEIFYFNHYNHATVQRLRLDPSKQLSHVKIEAIANEVIMGIIGISLS